MPTYTFRHKEKHEDVIEVKMKMSERDAWVEAHPDYEQTHDSINLADPIRLGISKPPSDFQKEIIGRVSKMHGSEVTSQFGIPREW